MTKRLNHTDWVVWQFNPRGLKATYRNVILHSSFIEGVLRREVWGEKKKGSFHEAIERLSTRGRITSHERQVFMEVKNLRNDLVHDSFKNRFTQKQTEACLNDLWEKILKAYGISTFLDDELFKKYRIPRRVSGNLS